MTTPIPIPDPTNGPDDFVQYSLIEPPDMVVSSPTEALRLIEMTCVGDAQVRPGDVALVGIVGSSVHMIVNLTGLSDPKSDTERSAMMVMHTCRVLREQHIEVVLLAHYADVEPDAEAIPRGPSPLVHVFGPHITNGFADELWVGPTSFLPFLCDDPECTADAHSVQPRPASPSTTGGDPTGS